MWGQVSLKLRNSANTVMVGPQIHTMAFVSRLSEAIYFLYRGGRTMLKPVIVTVADNALMRIQEVADQLASKGMKVKRVMPVTGVISGLCPPSKTSALEKVGGVVSVEEEAVAHLPPPDSPIQ
jgi:hypothetical protein